MKTARKLNSFWRRNDVLIKPSLATPSKLQRRMCTTLSVGLFCRSCADARQVAERQGRRNPGLHWQTWSLRSHILSSMSPPQRKDKILEWYTEHSDIVLNRSSFMNNETIELHGKRRRSQKVGGTALTEKLLQLFLLIWEQQTIPKDFRDASVIHLYKRKGNRQACDNHRKRDRA